MPFHYDSGLLLMLTSFNKHPLKIKNNRGKEVSTAGVGDDGILILVARGLSDWLLKGIQFKIYRRLVGIILHSG